MNMDSIIQVLERLRPIVALAEEIALLLETDSNSDPMSWLRKYMPHLQALHNVGDKQVVLIAAPNWFSKELKCPLPVPEDILNNQKGDVFLKVNQLNSKLLQQALIAFELKYYNLCVVGLSVLLEGLVIDVLGKEKIKETSIRKNVEDLIYRVKRGDFILARDKDELCLFVTLERSLNRYAEHSDFMKDEPTDIINRHWLAHGRTRRDYSANDCLKLMSMIAGVELLKEDILK